MLYKQYQVTTKVKYNPDNQESHWELQTVNTMIPIIVCDEELNKGVKLMELQIDDYINNLYKSIDITKEGAYISSTVLLRNAVKHFNSKFSWEAKEVIEHNWGPYSITTLFCNEDSASFVYRFGNKYVLVKGEYVITKINHDDFIVGVVDSSWKYVAPMTIKTTVWKDV